MLPTLCTHSLLISAPHCVCHKLHRTNRTFSTFLSGTLLHVQHSCNLMPPSREAEHVASAAKQPQLSPPLSVSQPLSITVAAPKAPNSRIRPKPRLRRRTSAASPRNPVRSTRADCLDRATLISRPGVVWQLSHRRTSARHSFLAARPSSSGHPPHRPKQSRLCEMQRGAWRLPAAHYPSMGKWMCFPGLGELSAAFSQKVRILLPWVFFFFFFPHCGQLLDKNPNPKPGVSWGAGGGGSSFVGSFNIRKAEV